MLLGIIVGLELTFGDGKLGSFRVHPHPYWLVVLPMAAARGLVAGVTAAVLATLAYVAGARDELAVERILDLLDFEIMREPMLFLSVSFLVGEFRDIAAERIRKLTEKRDTAENEVVRIREQRDVLNEASRILERRLVDQNTQFGSLMEVSARAEGASPAEIQEIALELVDEHCGASASILLPRLDGTVELLCYRGWARNEVDLRLGAARDSELVLRAIREGREINGYALNESPPDAGPLVVSPLTGSPGRIDALLCLDEVPPSLLNSSTIRTFRAISAWTSALLGRTETDAGSGSRGGDAPRLEPTQQWIGSAQQFGSRLLIEYDRSVRHGLPLSFLAIRVTRKDGHPSPSMAMVDEFILDRFSTRIRASDSVYRYPRPGCYVLVLPGTPVAGASALKSRLVPEDNTDWVTPGIIDVKAAGPEPGTPDPQSLIRQLGRLFSEAGEPDPADGQPAIEIPAGSRIGTLEEFLRTLVGELSLAMRNEYPLQVLSLRTERFLGVDSGLLALHLHQAAGNSLRSVDAAFSVGAGHVALILPHSEPDQAMIVADRLMDALREVDREPPYGTVTAVVMSYGPQYAYHVPFLEALAATRLLRDVPVAGGHR